MRRSGGRGGRGAWCWPVWPGVGKTRLAGEALVAAERRGAAARWAAGTGASQGLPLGAFAALLGRPVGIRPRCCGGLPRTPFAGAGRPGVVVGVDDAHLLDELSALLVHQLVLQAVATVVVTVRTGRAPDAITALWKDGHLDRLEVQPLSEPETGALLEAVLGGPLESGAAHRLWTITRGNVLYLRHLVDAELESGRLWQAAGVWRWSGEPALSPGPGRTGDGPDGQVARTAARGGGRARPRRAAGRCPARPAHWPRCGGAGRGARPGESGAGRAAAAGPARPPALWRGPASRVWAAACPPATRSHRDGGGPHPVGAAPATPCAARCLPWTPTSSRPALPTAAADAAVQRLDMALAERLARAAVAGGGGFDARRTLAYALGWLSRGAEADTELTTLAELATTDIQPVEAALPRASNLFWTLGRPEEAEAVLDAAEAAIADEGARHALTALRADFHAFLGRRHRAVRSALEALGSRTLPDPAVMVATYGLVVGMGVLGRADGIGPAASRAYAVAGRSFDAAVLSLGLGDIHLAVLRLAGYLHEAERIALERHEQASDAPGPLRLCGVALLGHAALGGAACGPRRDGSGEARAGLAPFETIGFEFCCALRLTQALAMAGDRRPRGRH